MLKKKAKSKTPTVDGKLIEEVKKAEASLEAYLKANKLDPAKDHSKDKKHGKEVKELISILELARKKVKEAAPEEIHHKKADDVKKEKTPKKKEAKPTKYDYPLVDGKEMTSDQKKKYRIQQRAASNKAEKTEKKKDAPKVEKTDSKKIKSKEVKPEEKKKLKKKVKKTDD